MNAAGRVVPGGASARIPARTDVRERREIVRQSVRRNNGRTLASVLCNPSRDSRLRPSTRLRFCHSPGRGSPLPLLLRIATPVKLVLQLILRMSHSSTILARSMPTGPPMYSVRGISCGKPDRSSCAQWSRILSNLLIMHENTLQDAGFPASYGFYGALSDPSPTGLHLAGVFLSPDRPSIPEASEG